MLAVYKWTGSTFLAQTTNNVYNPNGTPSKTYDLANNETDYAYASGNYINCPTGGCTAYPFPTTITNNGTGLATSATWYALGGASRVVTDANGNNSLLSYADATNTADPYWRVRVATDPLGAQVYTAVPSGSWPGLSGISLPFNGTYPNFNSIIGVVDETDAFGRNSIAQVYQSPTATNFDTVSTAYGWSGNYRQVQYSEPCSVAFNVSCPALSHTILYDPLGRVHTSSTASNETLTHTYNKNNDLAVLSPAPTGENNKQAETTYDALGRVTNRCYVGAGNGTACANDSSLSGLNESYAYTSAAGSTTVAVTRGGQTKTSVYDALGRLISKAIPEGGTTTYTYDTVPTACTGMAAASAGDLICVVDANGNPQGFSYDSMHRLTAVGSGSYCKRFRYDNTTGVLGSLPTGVRLTNPLGHLSEAETDDCTWPVTAAHQITDEWLAYDAGGNVLNQWEMTPHSGQYYKSTATFYGNGAVATLQLASPASYTMTFGLDGEGRVKTITDSTHSKNFVTGATYFPAADPDGTTIASSDSDAFTWDTNTGRMTKYQLTANSTTLTGALTWNANGTLNQLATTDGFNSGGTQTCLFNPASGMGYDDGGRLQQIDCGSGNWGQTFSYDNFDNLKKTVMSGHTGTTWNPIYSSSTNHCSGCTYDSDGNVTGDGNFVYGWNSYGKMRWSAGSGTPTCGTTGKCITYDAFGRIVETSNNSTYRQRWITQLGETAIMSGTTISFAYWPAPHGGKIIANGNDTSAVYLHPDWKGNGRITSNLSSHAIDMDQAFSPYGEIFSAFGSTATQKNQFAGMTENFYSGAMWDTPNRELAIAPSRWNSPDPAGAGWNPYAYPTNPNSAIDPTGLNPIKVG